MKKILIGICGLGLGHLNRQINFIKLLQKFDVELLLAVTENNIEFLDNLFPKLTKLLIKIPWIFCSADGVDFSKSLSAYKSNDFDYFEEFLSFGVEVRNFFSGNPDFVFSDYEPNVAQFAYASNIPLISFEQQSKFLFFDDLIIENLSLNEEISRLKYFFPKVHKRLISSFFPLNVANSSKNILMPPILDVVKKQKTNMTKCVVYFSPYSSDYKRFMSILNLIKLYPKINFIVYSNINFKEFSNYKHIFFKKIGLDFKSDLSDCTFIISSSGHQLISEAINYEIPLYLFSFNTFEQKYNSRMVSKYSLGKLMDSCDPSEFDDFIRNIVFYKSNMASFKKKFWNDSWESVFINFLKDGLNLIESDY